MSALTDLFTAMANKIRSKTGTATTYTPLEMVSDGIDDVYDAGYAAGGGGGGTSTPITPSNSSPASMTTGTTYEAMGNGYAIESYSSVTPSNSSPVSLTSGSIYKMGGAGKAVASVADITPSDSSPAALTSGSIYKAGGAGYAIASSPTSVTPSSSGTYFSSGIKKMASSGYAYSAQPKKTASGTQVMSTTAQVTINCGFKPGKVVMFNESTPGQGFIYDSDWSTSKCRYLTNSGNQDANLGSTTNNIIYSVSSTGWTVNKVSSARTYRYFAIEE